MNSLKIDDRQSSKYFQHSLLHSILFFIRAIQLCGGEI